MNPTANYRMTKSGKIMLARNWNNPNLSVIRKALILGELKSKEIVRSKRDRTGDAQ